MLALDDSVEFIALIPDADVVGILSAADVCLDADAAPTPLFDT
jgi:hypothetical protein